MLLLIHFYIIHDKILQKMWLLPKFIAFGFPTFVFHLYVNTIYDKGLENEAFACACVHMPILIRIRSFKYLVMAT